MSAMTRNRFYITISSLYILNIFILGAVYNNLISKPIFFIFSTLLFCIISFEINKFSDFKSVNTKNKYIFLIFLSVISLLIYIVIYYVNLEILHRYPPPYLKYWASLLLTSATITWIMDFINKK